MVLDDMDHGVE
jgi:hypothetical protein